MTASHDAPRRTGPGTDDGSTPCPTTVTGRRRPTEGDGWPVDSIRVLLTCQNYIWIRPITFRFSSVTPRAGFASCQPSHLYPGTGVIHGATVSSVIAREQAAGIVTGATGRLSAGRQP